jgi:hypothetical protein
MEKPSVTSKQKRPIVITIVCVWILLGIIGMVVGLAIPQVRTELTKHYGSTAVPVAIISIMLNAVGLAGYWRMRVWGVYAFAAMTAVNAAWCFTLGISGLANLVGPVVVMLAGLYYWDEMDRDVQ